MPLWTAILALAVFMYVLLGFDLGVGILFGLRRDPPRARPDGGQRRPGVETSTTWLILGGGGLLAVFPLAFAVLMPALYFPILLMLLGLLFRGVAFEFPRGRGVRGAAPGTTRSSGARSSPASPRA